ncbi:hypothetical protein M062_12520 [Pseudomonas aeruginosa RP73]|nr:hypothetical protein M062_12520 [Pseudomonas aeruginosa RP73]
MAKTALRLQGLHQLLERQVLVRLGLQRALAGLGQQLVEAHPTVQVGLEHLGVDEEADQPLDLHAVAIGDRHADTDIRLPAVAIQQRLERSQQQGEGSSPLLLGHAPERLGQINIQFQDELGTTMALPNRARPVERQLQHRLLAAQQAGPVRQLALLFPCLHPAALPQGVVRVLDRQSRQRYLEPSTIGGIELDQFLDHHLHRPTVGHDVMLDQHQHMVVLGQPQQAHPQQRPTLQVERPRDRRLDLPSEGALLERPQRDDIQRQCHGCGDLLARLVAVEAKTGA